VGLGFLLPDIANRVGHHLTFPIASRWAPFLSPRLRGGEDLDKTKTGAQSPAAPVKPSRARISLHRALFIVGILGILHCRGDGLHRHHALGILDRFPGCRNSRSGSWFVLYLKSPRSDLKLAFLISARDLGPCFERSPFSGLGGRGDQHDRVVALRAIVGRIDVVLLLEVGGRSACSARWGWFVDPLPARPGVPSAQLALLRPGVIRVDREHLVERHGLVEGRTAPTA